MSENNEETHYGSIEEVIQESAVSPEDVHEIDSGEELKGLIREMLIEASNLIESFAGRDFWHYEDETANVDGNGRSELRLSKASGGLFYPITEIRSVSISGSELPASEYRAKPSEGKFDPGILERRNSVWPAGWENIEVDLDWGFEEVPPAIDAVAEGMVIDAILEAKANKTGGGADSISMDGFSITYGESGSPPDELLAKLKPYRRVAFG